MFYVIHVPSKGFWHNDGKYVEKEKDASFFTQNEFEVCAASNTIGDVANWKPTSLTREQLFTIVYRKTHKDFKGLYHGQKTIVSNAKYGGGLVSFVTISDNELCDRLN